MKVTPGLAFAWGVLVGVSVTILVGWVASGPGQRVLDPCGALRARCELALDGNAQVFGDKGACLGIAVYVGATPEALAGRGRQWCTQSLDRMDAGEQPVLK